MSYNHNNIEKKMTCFIYIYIFDNVVFYDVIKLYKKSVINAMPIMSIKIIF